MRRECPCGYDLLPCKVWICAMRQIRIRKSVKRPTPQDIDTRTPSGKPLPY